MTGPLVRSLRELTRRTVTSLHLSTDVAGEGWIRCADVVADPRVLAGWQQRLRRSLGGQVPDVVPTAFVLGWYSGVFAGLAGGLFHLARRVPVLAPGALAFRLHPDHWPHEVMLLRPQFACLPGDPDAAHPDALVVADETDLARLARERTAEHARPLLRALAPTTRIGDHALWSTVADALLQGVWGAAAGRPGRAAAADVRLLLPDAAAPFRAPAAVTRARDAGGRPFWSWRRRSCCYAYKLDAVERPCLSCPRTGDAERAAVVAGLPDDDFG